MDERSRRIWRNEALFRQVNEELAALEHGLAAIADQTLHIVCECGDLRCQERIVVPLSAYENARSNSALFLVVPGHEILSVEEIVEVTEQFNIVRKHGSGPSARTAATDARA